MIGWFVHVTATSTPVAADNDDNVDDDDDDSTKITTIKSWKVQQNFNSQGYQNLFSISTIRFGDFEGYQNK